jgi:hypothetical protein
VAFLTKTQILEFDDRQTEAVAVPEWGGDVMVHGLTGAERDQFEASVISRKGRDTNVNMVNFRAKLIALSVVDAETGARLFDDADVGALGRKSAAALQRVFDVAQKLSGLSREDVDELTKNSESEPNDGSGSGSL